MKINSTNAFCASRGDLGITPHSSKNEASEKIGAERSTQFRRSEFRRSDRSLQESQELQVPHGMQDGVRTRSQRHHPYLRPAPFVHASQQAHDMDLVHRNEFAVCKLYDQMRAMLPRHPTSPGNPSSLEFNVDGQSYQLRATEGGYLMIDHANPYHAISSMKIENGNSVRGMELFPGGQEQLAALLTYASARLQDVTS